MISCTVLPKLGLEEWYSPPQSSDVEPCDFHVFGKTKNIPLPFGLAQDVFVVKGYFFAPIYPSHKITVYSSMFQFC